jgi:hypothetical protein
VLVAWADATARSGRRKNKTDARARPKPRPSAARPGFSRANILQALASATKKFASLTTANDSELRKKVQSRLTAEPWRPTMLTVTVQDRTVDLWGCGSVSRHRRLAHWLLRGAPAEAMVVARSDARVCGYACIRDFQRRGYSMRVGRSSSNVRPCRRDERPAHGS